jgi:hypothetical protein
MNTKSQVVTIILENQTGADTEERLSAALEMVFARCEQGLFDSDSPVDNSR